MADADKQFTIRRTYLKDASFESPRSPEIWFGRGNEPRVEMTVRVEPRDVGEDRYEVVVTSTVVAKREDGDMFLCEVAQAGLFVCKGYSPVELEELLNIHCPVMLFPYIRAQVTHLTVMGGFPPVLLAPVDFDQMYAASKRAAAGKA